MGIRSGNYTAPDAPAGAGEIATLLAATPDAGDPGRALRQRRRAGDGSTRTCIALVDRYSLTRQCISRALQGLSKDLVVLSFASIEEVPIDQMRIDLVLYHWHGRDADSENLSDALPPFWQMANGIPLVLLSNIEHPETIIPTLQKGVRGYIPIESTTLDLMLKIIQLIEAGGTFIPEVSLSVHTNIAELETIALSRDQFTAREKAVLALLKCGKPNKTIAHELSMSVSTVKAHIRSIMRKLKVRNRTEAVSRAYGGSPLL
jgi:DNA-binding NarL/FixJ family response regulator